MPIHRRFFGQMARVDVDREPPAVPVTIVMGRHDESVPISGVWEVWQSWQAQGLAVGRFVEIEEGDHGLTEFVDRIAAEARELAK
jgi:pimeloyl-ACP methyl ester carboxylesterase